MYNNGTEFGLYYPTTGENDEYVPILDRELSAADNALTYAEFVADDDCTTIQIDNITGDMTNITSYITDLSDLVVDEVADMGTTEEHQNDKALYFTPATT